MATAHDGSDVNVDDLHGAFDLSSIAVYNIVNLGRFVLNSFCNSFNFCVELKLVKNQRTCARCWRNLKLSVENRPGHSTPVVFRCTNRSCRTNYVSIRQGSFFEHSHLSLQQLLLLVNLFCSKITSYDQIQLQGQLDDKTLSTETIADWLSYCREVCLETIARETPKLIGGTGLTVEIDESKFGKRKYNKGRLVEGQWVVGGICRETGDVFLAVCPNNKRDAETLLDIIERHVDKQSTVITDCWRAYNELDREGWQHLTVNHEYNFVGASLHVLNHSDVFE